MLANDTTNASKQRNRFVETEQTKTTLKNKRHAHKLTWTKGTAQPFPLPLPLAVPVTLPVYNKKQHKLTSFSDCLCNRPYDGTGHAQQHHCDHLNYFGRRHPLQRHSPSATTNRSNKYFHHTCIKKRLAHCLCQVQMPFDACVVDFCSRVILLHREIVPKLRCEKCRQTNPNNQDFSLFMIAFHPGQMFVPSLGH